MKNLLIKDPSPYLQQHAKNPVHWQPWNEQTLKLAKDKKKPILLSIGYASCHWCHVMAHESFEDLETAKIMNDYFINIKVDREERPDIDFIFQSSYQLFNQSGGGWPLTMFLDENAVPFMGGTYFPKIEQNGLPSFKNILFKINETYTEKKEQIISQSNLIKKSLEIKKNPVISQELEVILDQLINNTDKINGGFIGSPKFPTFNVFDTFIYFFNKTKNQKYLEPVKVLLKNLCSRGIYDHVEGGISRYSVDEKWIVPHFEKMLYDNTQFISLLSKYVKIDSDEYFKHKIKQTIDFLNVNFINNKYGLLGSALDADSDGEEGKYYIFKYNELENIKDIKKYFKISLHGNWEGKNILDEIQIPPNHVVKELLKIRQKRNKPFFDDKIQLDLNCLWISSLIHAHQILPNEGYLKLSEKFYDNIEKRFKDNQLHHSYSKNIIFIEDYAYLINALIDLADSTLEAKYRLKAKNLCEEAINRFYIKKLDIFQKNEIQLNDLFIEPLDIGDHTIPNGNAIMLSNFSRLGLIKEGEKLSNSLNGYLNVYKNYMVSSIKFIDIFNDVLKGKNCNEKGCIS